MKFKLMRGLHSQDVKTGKKDKDGKDEVVDKIFRAREPSNNIVESDIDLELKYGADKFQSIDRLQAGGVDIAALQKQLDALRQENERLKAAQEKKDEPEQPNLETMSVKELRKYAASFEPPIDLEGMSNKDEIIHAIQSELDTA